MRLLSRGRFMNKLCITGLLLLMLFANTAFAADPLASWNDTANKKAILTFVEQVTKEGSPNFVPLAERIATFDNDGTLWPEQPMYFGMNFVLARVRAVAPLHPEWDNEILFKAALENDIKTINSGGLQSWLKLDIATRAGVTTEEYAQFAKDWSATALHPKTGKRYTQMVYQPMLELLDYLRANGFKTYIVSGGWIDFMRPWVQEVYGIPPEQVIGSSFKTELELRDGKPVIVYLPEINFVSDNAGKAIGINHYIGRRPIAAFGNSDGDIQMLEWTTAGSGPRLALLIHHTDADREWAYDRNSTYGRLDKALDEAQVKGWTVVDMKQDWKIIYAFEKR